MSDEPDLIVIVGPPLPDVEVIVEPAVPGETVITDIPSPDVSLRVDAPRPDILSVQDETESEFGVVFSPEGARGAPGRDGTDGLPGEPGPPGPTQFFVGGSEPAPDSVPILWLEEVDPDIYEMRLVL